MGGSLLLLVVVIAVVMVMVVVVVVVMVVVPTVPIDLGSQAQPPVLTAPSHVIHHQCLIQAPQGREHTEPTSSVHGIHHSPWYPYPNGPNGCAPWGVLDTMHGRGGAGEGGGGERHLPSIHATPCQQVMGRGGWEGGRK